MPWIIPEIQKVFLHVPKTGGNWLVEAVRSCGMDIHHVQNDEHFDANLDLEPTYQRVTILRNPIGWYPSYWANVKKNGPTGLSCLEICKTCVEHLDSFPNFMEAVLREHPAYLTGLYAQYARAGVHTLYTETIRSDLHLFLEICGVPLDSGTLYNLENQNRTASLPEYASLVHYSPGMIARVVRSEEVAFCRYPRFDPEYRLPY